MEKQRKISNLKGEGTKDKPFLIENMNDLLSISDEKYLDKNYFFKQISDIDIKLDWETIGEKDSPFIGNYDGNNNKIINLNKPLFFEIEDSHIENIILENIKIGETKDGDELDEDFEESDEMIFATISNYSNNSHINNCILNGKIFYSNIIVNNILMLSPETPFHLSCGGIIGINKNSNISDCKSNLEINLDFDCTAFLFDVENINLNCGGIVGYNSQGNISNCKLNSNINLKFNCENSVLDLQVSLGGIVGYNSQGNISNCKVNEKIFSQIKKTKNNFSLKCGGITGINKESNIENCKITGIISSTSTPSVGEYYHEEYISNFLIGGIVGDNNYSCINNCNTKIHIIPFFKMKKKIVAKIFSKSYCGGVAGITSSGEIKNCDINALMSSEANTDFFEYYYGEIISSNKVEYLKDNNINVFKLEENSNFIYKSYLELGWDFENIWEWNKEENKPIFRNIQKNSEEKIENENKTNPISNLKGEGTEDNPFLIENMNNLLSISDEKYLNKNYFFKQISDIDIKLDWETIGEKDNPFIGNYDGNNNKILNLNKPLFFEIEDSHIENIILENMKIGETEIDDEDLDEYFEEEFCIIDEEDERNSLVIGSIANFSQNSHIKNCNINGEIFCINHVYTSSEATCGGIIGSNTDSNIDNCMVNANIKLISDCEDIDEHIDYSISCCGGITGDNTNGEITNCIVNSYITSQSDCGKTGYNADSEAICGGIVGININGNISNCIVNGILTSESEAARKSSQVTCGGIVANNNGNITNCSVNGILNFISSAFEDEHHEDEYRSVTVAGGIVGNNSGTIKNCTTKLEMTYHNSCTAWLEEFVYDYDDYEYYCYSSGLYCGGIVGTNEEGEISNCDATTYIHDNNYSKYEEYEEEYNRYYFGGIIGFDEKEQAKIKNCNVSSSIYYEKNYYLYNKLKSRVNKIFYGEIVGSEQKDDTDNNINKWKILEKKLSTYDEFYNTLDWDFENIWEWDKETKKLSLK